MAHLKQYKYQSVDKSFISNYILRHYVTLPSSFPAEAQSAHVFFQWNGAVKLLPMSLAPNMVTLLGFVCILVNVAFLQIFLPDLIGPGPSWLYYSFALGLWA
jgi:ethanolaminephosphotransferase